MKRLMKTLLSLILMTVVIAGISSVTAFGESDPPKAKRTIMLYCCGSNLESVSGMATYNLRQILKSSFSADDDIRFIVMTGGAGEWQLDDDDNNENDNGLLVFPDNVNLPDDAVQVFDPDALGAYRNIYKKGSISNIYNQIWEAKGADAPENAGKLVLLDGDGITGEANTSVKSADELMSVPGTLKAFINYGAEHFPAEKYDLILWDHGGGPVDGFGWDDHYNWSAIDEDSIKFAGIAEALRGNKVTDPDSDGEPDSKFDFVDFDACLMSSMELALVLADYTDYYIASADTEPGYGQYYGPCEGKYKGWLDELGDEAKDHIYNGENGTFELGKVLINDFYEFYEKDEGDGYSQDGTLAIFDTAKMLDPQEGFIQALKDLNDMLKSQAEDKDAENRIQFFDELRSYANTIDYADYLLYDLGDLVALLGTVNSEMSSKNIVDGEIVWDNEYSGLANRFLKWFGHDGDLTTISNNFMYGRVTLGETTEENYYYSPDNDDLDVNRSYGILFSTGISVFFPDTESADIPLDYYYAIDNVLDEMPVQDDRYELLRSYEETVADYSIIIAIGQTVDRLLYNKNSFNFVEGDKTKIDYDLVIKEWNDGWTWDTISEHLSKRRDGADGSVEWLTTLVDQIVRDAVSADDVTAAGVTYKNDYGYKINLNNTSKKIVDRVERSVLAELPVLQEYLNSLSDLDREMINNAADLSIGSVEGIAGEYPENATPEQIVEWYEKGGSWELGPLEQKWHAINDASGKYHVASIYRSYNDSVYIPVLVGTDESVEAYLRMVLLEFSNDPESNSQTLRALHYMSSSAGPRNIDPKTLTEDLTIMPIMYITPAYGKNHYAPISRTSFVISADNADAITLDFTDLKNIEDIEDTDGDGWALDSRIIVKDIFGYKVDVTKQAKQKTDGELIHISAADIKQGTYTGKTQKPKLVYKGETLKEGVDYTFEKADKKDKLINVGTYGLNFDGTGKYTGYDYKKFKIVKAANPLKIKAKKASLKYSKLKKKAQTLDVKKVIRFKKKANDRKTYKLISAKKGGKSFKSKFKINKKTGKVTVKKGLKKGSYKVRVKVQAAGNSNYKKSTWKKVTFTVRVS